jgi:hypothetical protein
MKLLAPKFEKSNTGGKRSLSETVVAMRAADWRCGGDRTKDLAALFEMRGGGD